MLRENEIEFRYRDYRDEPLSVAELRRIVDSLGVEVASLFRRRDPAFKKLDLGRVEDPEVLYEALAANPTLLQRPIGVLGERAAVGRPPEALLQLASDSP